MSPAPDRRAAFQALFLRHGPAVRGFLLKVGAGSQADDLLQETFLRAYRVQGEEPRSERAWLLGIARHLWIDVARRAARGKQAVEDLSESASERAASAGELGAQREARARLREALADLGTEERALLLQRYGQGVALADLASAEACTERTVRNRIGRALERLVQALIKTGGRL